jgi:uncharacterized protein (TIGR00251 family)
VACYRTEPGAIVVAVRLTPRADRDAVEGIGALADGREVARVRVRAVPEAGAANAALIRLMAKTFGRPKSAVTIAAGAGQRLKQIRIAGETPELVRIVESWPKRA